MLYVFLSGTYYLYSEQFEKQTHSDISYKQPCECYCTEIGRVRHIVKNRLTGLSFTTGLVIRISHDEGRGSAQPEAIH